MRDLIRRGVSLAAAAWACVLAAGMVAGLPGTAAAATTLTAVEAPLPANAGTSPYPNLASVSCAAAGNCTAVGVYTDSSGNAQGLLLTQTAGTWVTGIEAPPPANAGASQSGVYLSDVSCAAAGNCTAVGRYTDSSGQSQGLLLTQTAGTWATGIEAPLPANAGPSPAYTPTALTSVSCASAGDCTAVGYYTDSAGHSQGLLLTQTSGTWATGVEMVLPADAGPRANGGAGAVSCVSAGNCTATGGYADSSGAGHWLLLTQTAGTWGAGIEPVRPANADPKSGGGPASLSCSSVGNCTAVGEYTDPSGDAWGLVLTQTAGTWGAGIEAPLPAGADPGLGASVISVSCSSPGNCAATGSYGADGAEQGLLLTETGGTWATGVEASPPAPQGWVSQVDSVSCASAGNCTAVTAESTGLVLTETAGTWATGVAPAFPGGSTAGHMNSVSCASAGNCTIVGAYLDNSGNYQGLLVTQTTQTQPTTTAVASSANPSPSGQSVTYTATVSPVPDGGTVAFTDGTTAIAGCGAQPVDPTTGRATCQTTPGTTGSHDIAAAFNGSGSFAASTSATVTQVVTSTPCAHLAGCNLSGLNLAGADLAGADLVGANFNKANLVGADLAGATVTATTNFNKVTWSDTTCPDGTNSNADGGTCIGHL
jgi:hypothetical protein